MSDPAPRRSPLAASERVARVVFSLLPLVPAAMLAIGAWRQRWMDDDGFINLRVVRNLLHGHGPVFNLGERVEVCTSPLWLALLTALGAIGMPLEATAVYLGIELTIVAMVLAVYAADRFQKSDDDRPDAIVWPVGAGIFAVIPAAWDYASSGLETGLGLAWLAGSYSALARILGRSELRPRSRGAIATAVLFGLGPLIRPELALYSAVWFLPLVVRLAREHQGSSRRAAGSLALLGASAIVLPLAYELFRMGYYGTVTPNTAIAKEAFRINWTQGLCYFHNFFGVYAMGWAAAAVAVFFAARLRGLLASKDVIGAIATIAPAIAGLGHIVYIVAMGGDYMHGRMFLPPVFAILLPIAVVRLGTAPRWEQGSLAVVGGMLVVWMAVCCLKLRVPTENECMIGDERRWYVNGADVAAPIDLARYRKHQFYKAGAAALEKIRGQCESIDREGPKGERCRTLYFDDDTRDKDKGHLTPQRDTYPLAADIEPSVGVAVASGAIGIFGYLMPDAVHVIDRHGLAEPLASHLEVGKRGRPGHEKKLSDSWLVARYAAPLVPDDARVTAARHALACGDLRALVLAATAPMTWRRFFDNVTHSFAQTKLRIPLDTFEAEVRFCGTRPLATLVAGGDGGEPFRWQCAGGAGLVALRGGSSDADAALARVQPVCGNGGAGGESADEPDVGPPFGGKSDADPAPTPFEVACPSGSVAVGLFGTKDKLVTGIGLVCGAIDGGTAAPTVRSASAGAAGSSPFELRCPIGSRVVGIVGRAGDLLDQLGAVCGP